MCMDSTIPRRCLADMLVAIGAMEKKHRLRCVNVFHAGDGNLHPLILFDANERDELHRAEAFGAEILELSVAMGGTVTGEHGVGVEKLGSMCVQFSPAERAQMLALKAAFDPAGLLNPGKMIPTLTRCAEGGKMHVKRGLPRVPRAAAVLSAATPSRRSPSASAQRPARAGRCRSAAAARRHFYGEAAARRSCSTRAASMRRPTTSRPSSSSPPRRACAWPPSRRCWPGAASAWPSSRRISAPMRPSAA